MARIPWSLPAGSPPLGGTTIQGIRALEKGGFTASVMEAVEAAARKASEMEAYVMLDLKFVRENIDAVKANTANRHVSANPDLVVELYDKRNGILKELENLRASRNSNADKMKAKLSPEDRARLAN